MPTYKLIIEYEGTRYSGWQAQGNTQRTIQGHLLRAAREVLGDVEIGGAGRTDAGVHAAGQVAHLRARKTLDPLILTRKINDLLPHDIDVLEAIRVGDGFHARHDAICRVYLYQLSTRRTAFAKPFVWWIKDPLDFGAMRNAAAAISGRHDFGAFADKRLKDDESRIVVVERCELARAGDLIVVRIAASHFLWKMVRKLISFLVEVGRGNETDIRSRLAPDAEPYSPTAPPSGLFLETVVYPGERYDRPLVPIVPVGEAVGGRRSAVGDKPVGGRRSAVGGGFVEDGSFDHGPRTVDRRAIEGTTGGRANSRRTIGTAPPPTADRRRPTASRSNPRRRR